MITFNTENMSLQTFPFCDTIMKHIFKNVSASKLIKLYQTCKFFYNKFQYNIIENFEICVNEEDERIVKNSLAIWRQNPSYKALKNIWVSKSFTHYDDLTNVPIEKEKFARMTYNTLEFPYGTYSVEDYEYLVKCPSVRYVFINGAVCYSDTELNVSIDELMVRAPYAATFNLTLYNDFFWSYPAIDMTKLISTERQTKLTSLHIHNVGEIPDPLLVVEFFMKHAVEDVDYYFDFDIFDYNAENVKRFYTTVDDGLRAWKLSLQLPPAISSFFDLNGKTAVVRGATEDIGRTTVILFRQLGASVIAVGRNRKQINDLIDECQNIKNNGILLTLSADDNTGLRRYDEMLKYKFDSKCDILVNVADTLGEDIIPHNLSFVRLKYSVLQDFHNVLQKSVPHLTKAKGNIIHVSYPDFLITKPEDAKYNAYFEQEIKIAETKLASSGVRINSVNLDAPPTALPRPNVMTDADYKKLVQESKNTYDQQVANAIAFLASDAAKLIDGAVLPVNALNLG